MSSSNCHLQPDQPVVEDDDDEDDDEEEDDKDEDDVEGVSQLIAAKSSKPLISPLKLPSLSDF